MKLNQIDKQISDLLEEYSYLPGDKFVVVYRDGTEEEYKHTDIESVIYSVSMEPLHHVHNIYNVADIFDI